MAFPGFTLRRSVAHRVASLVSGPHRILMPTRPPYSTSTLQATFRSQYSNNSPEPHFSVSCLLGTSRLQSSFNTLALSSRADPCLSALRWHSSSSGVGPCSRTTSLLSRDSPNAPSEFVPHRNETRAPLCESTASVDKDAPYSAAGNLNVCRQSGKVAGSIASSATLMVRSAYAVPCAHAYALPLADGIQTRTAAALPLGLRIGAAGLAASGMGQAHAATLMGRIVPAMPHVRAFSATVGGADVARMGSRSQMRGDLFEAVLIQRRSFAKRPKKWHGDAMRWVSVEEGKPVLPSQPNAGSIGGRNKAWRQLKREAFKRVQRQTMQAKVAAANRAKAAKNYVRWKASMLQSQMKKKAASSAAAGAGGSS